ncbi:MAG: hemerythrin domain-containing protein [Lachnospiraceae bacterium]
MFDFKFDWSREVECGVKILDEQHRELFRIGRDIEQLLTNKCTNVTNAQLLDIVRSLRDYASYHIYTKEMLMKKYRYPKYFIHRKSLYALEKSILSIDMDELGRNPVTVLTQLKEALQKFLYNHILIEANELGRYLNSWGVY